jgi:hypothetical protein
MHVLHAGAVAVVHDDGVGEEDERRVVTGSIGRVIGRGASVYRRQSLRGGLGTEFQLHQLPLQQSEGMTVTLQGWSWRGEIWRDRMRVFCAGVDG